MIGCTSGDGKDTVFITLFYFSYPCTFGHAFQSLKCPIMFLGLLDETSCVRGGDLASISTVFLPDERRGLGTPRQDEVASFVNFTNLGSRVGQGVRGARQSGGGTQTTSMRPPSLLSWCGKGGHCVATRALFFATR